ncbi:MAG: ATP synthase subunit I [Nitrosomonadales bacterium]|nr:ATP synthase subunit I [Nitrosomonadales bacterium]
MTPLENAAIIAALYAAESREKKLARQVIRLQAAITLIAAGIAYGLYGTAQFAMAVLSGGLVSVINGILLAWGMSRTALRSGHEAHDSSDAHHQLRLMYFYAAERFLAVVALLGLGVVVLKLAPLALLGGFVAGQATLLIAQLILSRFKTETATKNV